MAGRPQTRKNRRKGRRLGPKTKQRALLKDALRKSAIEAPDMQAVPDEALQAVLDRTYSMLAFAMKKVDRLNGTELWRNTREGRVPNEWIRLEQDLRAEVAYISGRMIDLNIEGRKANAAELMASAIAPVLKRILSELELTDEQRKAAPRIVRQHLTLLEKPAEPLTSSEQEDS